MEFPARTNVSLIPLFLVLVTCSTILNPIFAATTCNFPAIFNMGDSNSDTGSMSAAFTAFNLPNGETYFQTPSGRYSDGRLLIDFMARSLDLPYLSAYLDSLGANFSHGANFASSSATIRLPQKVIPTEGGWSPFYLPVQYEQFNQFKVRAQKIKEEGGIFAELMPRKEYFGQALYTFDIGQNDLSALFVDNTPFDEVIAIIPDIIYQFTEHVKKMYKLGARSFWIHNTGPIGCLSFTLTHFPSARKDVAGCALAYNKVAQLFNRRLKDAVLQLRKDLPLAALTYVDVYSVKYSLFRYPSRNGFENPLVACCGHGGLYNFTNSVDCGNRVIVNGTEMVVDSCDRPEVRVIWDGTHYTEAANMFVFELISSGAFSDPPIPLKMSCQRNVNQPTRSEE